MQLTVRVSREDDGAYRALCPELGLTAYGENPRNAVDKLKIMILEWVVSTSDEDEMDDRVELMLGGPDASVRRSFALLSTEEGVKLLYIPERKTRH